jgi:hypothetical protein
MNKFISLFLAVLLVTGLITIGCGEDRAEPIDSPEPIGGRIYAIDGNVILVVGGINEVNIPREEWFEAGKRAVYFTVTGDTIIEHKGETFSAERLARGQKVEVYHEGFLAESYPEQGGALRVVITDDTPAAEFQTDSGRFMGQIEDNSIEIKISGVPDEIPGRLYRLTAEARDHLDRLGLEVEEVIIFHYLPDEDYEGLIFDLNRIIN